MDKFFDRFKPKKQAASEKKKTSSGGGGFNFSLPGQNKFQGAGQSLGGSNPGKVLEIQLSAAGPLGIKVERRPNGAAIVGLVSAGSQAESAGLERGDILCFQGSNGQEEIPYDLFLQLAKSHQRPLCFEARRVKTKSAALNGTNGTGGSAEKFARQQAVIAAAEKREKEAKARNKKVDKTKVLPTLQSTEEQKRIEEERLARMDAAVENQSAAAKQAVQAAKRNEAQTAAQLGYNPYETNKVTAGQARNATVTTTHGAVQSTDNTAAADAMAALPAVRPPPEPAVDSAPVSADFEMAYESVLTSNDAAAVANSLAILRKLIANATTKGQGGDDEAQAAKFRKVRLTNAKIKAAIVDVEGALDLMMAVGFQLTEEDGESFLVYPKGFAGENWLPAALSMMENYEQS